MRLLFIKLFCIGVLFSHQTVASETLSSGRDQQHSKEAEPTGFLASSPRLDNSSHPVNASLFGLPENPSSIYQLGRQVELLEASQRLAMLLRAIKENGNDGAVLELLKSINEDVLATQYAAAFEEIDLAKPVIPVRLPQLPVPTIPTSQMNPASRAPLIPIMAQTAGEHGVEEQVVVLAGDRRFSRAPGQSIEFDGRVIFIDSIESEMVNGQEITTIWVQENGVREALEWLP